MNNKVSQKIFQIGFTNSGSAGLAETFSLNNYKVIYQYYKESEFCYRQYLAVIMYQNMIHRLRPIIHKELKNYDVYMNMEYLLDNYYMNFNKYFKILEEENQGSIFILTIQPVKNWLLSLLESEEWNRYFKDDRESKLISMIDYYFDHCIKLREYFIQNKNNKNRSKLYIYYLFKTDIQDFFKEMKLPIYPDINLNQHEYRNHLFNGKNNISPVLDKYIKTKLNQHGDPYQKSWWK